MLTVYSCFCKYKNSFEAQFPDYLIDSSKSTPLLADAVLAAELRG